jgi:hypothetical protein
MIYVDNAFIPAKVKQFQSKWCHLLSDEEDPESLHLFAESIGLKRSYFQPGKFCWWHQHYDLTLNKRKLAVAKGAKEIDIYDWIEIVDRLKNV